MLKKVLKNLDLFFFWIISAYFLYRIFKSLARSISPQMQVTWLINYDFGFTKRGLLGAVIKNLFEPGSALVINEIVIKLTIVVLITIYYLVIFRYRSNIYISLILILSPALIMFPINDQYVPGRIEQIGMIITAINCFFMRETLKSHNHLNVSDNNRQLKLMTCLTVSIPVFMLSLLMLAHEATLLLSVPVNFILTFIFIFSVREKENELGSLLFAVFTYVPVGLSFLFVLFNKNDDITHAYDLCRSIKEIFPTVFAGNCEEPYFILTAHVRPFPDVIANTMLFFRQHLTVYLAFVSLGFLLSMFSIKGISGVFQFEKTRKKLVGNSTTQKIQPCIGDYSAYCPSGGNRTLSAIILYFFLLPFLCTLPLYVVAKDWGRWIAAINLQFVITSLVFLNPTVMHLVSFPFIKRIPPFIKENSNSVTPYSFKMLILIICVCFIFRLPHWANYPFWFFSQGLWKLIKPYFY